MVSEAQKRANAKYEKDNVVKKLVKFYPADYDLVEWLKTKNNVQGYIKSLIRADMELHNGS